MSVRLRAVVVIGLLIALLAGYLCYLALQPPEHRVVSEHVDFFVQDLVRVFGVRALGEWWGESRDGSILVLLVLHRRGGGKFLTFERGHVETLRVRKLSTFFDEVQLTLSDGDGEAVELEGYVDRGQAALTFEAAVPGDVLRVPLILRLQSPHSKWREAAQRLRGLVGVIAGRTDDDMRDGTTSRGVGR